MKISCKREVQFNCSFWDGTTLTGKNNKWRITIEASTEAYDKAVLSFQAAVDYMQQWLDKNMTNKVVCNELAFNQIPDEAKIFPFYVTPLNAPVLTYFAEEMQKFYCDDFGFELTEIEVIE